ncbi:MAG: diguanylate cyclase [Candidatus Omnitrophica bacterium]|nr:diguanylate cyclase [Candidatus Omnitrophota bacterium]
MEKALRILLLSSSKELAYSISQSFEKSRKGIVIQAATLEKACELLSSTSFDIVFFDELLKKEICFGFLAELEKRGLNLPLVLLVDSEKTSMIAEAVKQGAFDYLVKTKDQVERISELTQSILNRFALMLREKRLENEVAKQRASLHEINQKLEAFAIHDELTGIYNHRYFQEKLYEEFLRARRYGHPLSCLMLDIDYFKSINDVRGHLVGDEVLKELAHILKALVRQMDVIARYGGEEFAILLPHVGYEGAVLFAERAKAAISDNTFLAGRYDLKLTVSVGVSSYPDDALQKHDDLLAFADRGLFHAKGDRGRNSICCYSNIMREIMERTPFLQMSGDKVAEFRKRLLDVSETAKRAYIESTKALVYALEAKDKYTLGHAARVGQYSAMVAREMGLSEDDVITIEHAGLLHDVGKVCISDEILLKQGPFTLEEYEKMKEHPTLGYRIVKPIKFLREEALIILHHHEWFNGQGYPHKLKGKEIPTGARIVSVLDAYDTMRAAGARYKKTLSCEEAVKELVKQSGTQFDPEAVQGLIRVLVKRGEISEEKVGI